MQSYARRQTIKGLMALGLIGVAGCDNKPDVLTNTDSERSSTLNKPKTYVFVHGAWHGGWCWRDVRRILEEAGHIVWTPTLSGMGGKTDPMNPDIGLETHIDDVTNVINENDLKDVILVAHSYGGMVATGVADRFQNRIKHNVYLDAIVPKDQDTMITAGPELSDEAIAATKAGLMALSTDGVAMMPLPPEAFGVLPDHPSYKWVSENLTPHPIKSWLDPITLKNGGAIGLPRTYIHCVSPVLQPSNIPYFAAKAKISNAWTYHELPTGHDAMITMPVELSVILEAL